MILMIDQGNSFLKWRTIDSKSLTTVKDSTVEVGDLEILLSSLKKSGFSISEIYLSSVKNERSLKNLTDALFQGFNVGTKIATTQKRYGNLICAYDDVSQMGVDRWLAMIATCHLHQHHQLKKQMNAGFILIDAGSALTFDVVNHQTQHLGGHIVPGLALQKKVLQQQTDRVIFTQAQSLHPYQLGVSTSEGVHYGCLSQVCGYLEQMISKCTKDAQFSVYLTGGDASYISQNLQFKHQVVDDLVLDGLFLYFNQ